MPLPPPPAAVPLCNRTAPARRSAAREKFFLADINEGKRCVVPVTSQEEGKHCSLILPYKNDCHRTTKVIRDGIYFTELRKESDDPEQKLAATVQEETWKNMRGPRPDKHRIKMTELSPLLKESSPKNHLPQNLNGSVERKCTSDKEKREKENASHKNGASQEIFEAVMAINSAKNLLPTFKDILGRMTNVCKLSTSEMIVIDTQEDLLAKELTALKTTKRLLWLLLQRREQKQIGSENIDALIQKLSENETHNTSLRRKIVEREEHIKELSSRIQLKKVPVLKEDNLSRPVNAIEAHLQYQIQRKEVENDELKLKTQTLEKKIAEWKLQTDDYKHQMVALRETSEQKKADLRRAIRSQKRKTECFEEAVENLTSRIKEREVKLSEILSASDLWKKQHDRMVEEKAVLAVQTEDLKKQITSLSEDLKRKEEFGRKTSEDILGKLNSVNSENEKIYLENEKLKASLAALEVSTVSVENDLLCLQEKTKLQENVVERYKNQVQELQAEVEVLKSRYKTVFSENKSIREGKCLEGYEVRDRTELKLKELEHVCGLLKAAEGKLRGFQENLVYWERINAQKRKTLREPQVQEEDGVNSVGNCSLEENSNIQKKYEHLKRMLEKMEFQNEELAYLIRKEDESLQCSKLQLEEKIAEYNSLTKQLESALEEGRKMVAEEFKKMSYLEQALETKMLVLENEVKERQEERKELLCALKRDEKHHEVRLKELEDSLQRSENKNQSIQNYVQFLKTSYITMFG
ncbi:protein BCAP isoform X2 [Phasianus colchicus]|uniref:protein BCAP isoform X2 n=1 Tax=Phasianus colchicus TaxID=9054 RepID=UPI00129EF514|nr:protein BCAP isoform X2 [Phasianus colchicus]